MPNITITPQPKTAIGIIRISAPMVTTCWLITPVTAISPTFWLNEVLGIAPNTPAIAVPSHTAETAPIRSPR